MKKYKRSLIVGKFSPLHKGHQLLITEAILHSDQIILFCYSNPEFPGCEVEKRNRWLTTLYPQAQVFVFSGHDCPPNEASDIAHREFCLQQWIANIAAPLDAIYSSETYGEGFARHMSLGLMARGLQNYAVESICFDLHRQQVPISGTAIRHNVHQHKDKLPGVVYADFVKSVVFLGGESTGKSTLCRHLAKIFATNEVQEYGRTLWEEKKGQLDPSDYIKIAKTHCQMEDQAKLTANQYLFVDTSPLTTLYYSLAWIGQADPELLQLSRRRYDFVFLCLPDFPLVQDGTRSDEAFRQDQHLWYLQKLQLSKVDYVPLAGSLEQRIDRVCEILKIPASI